MAMEHGTYRYKWANRMEVQAIHWVKGPDNHAGNWPEWVRRAHSKHSLEPGHWGGGVVVTPADDVPLGDGDWIIRVTDECLYVANDRKFRHMYELVTQS